jgi:hypothetical protein
MVRVEFCPGVNSHMVLVLPHRLVGQAMQTSHLFVSKAMLALRVSPDIVAAEVSEAYWTSPRTVTGSKTNTSRVA